MPTAGAPRRPDPSGPGNREGRCQRWRRPFFIPSPLKGRGKAHSSTPSSFAPSIAFSARRYSTRALVLLRLGPPEFRAAFGGLLLGLLAIPCLARRAQVDDLRHGSAHPQRVGGAQDQHRRTFLQQRVWRVPPGIAMLIAPSSVPSGAITERPMPHDARRIFLAGAREAPPADPRQLVAQIRLVGHGVRGIGGRDRRWRNNRPARLRQKSPGSPCRPEKAWSGSSRPTSTV